MLTDDDALDVLNHLRGRVAEAGYEDFDVFAFDLIASDIADEERQQPFEVALQRYVEVVQGMLKRIGQTHIRDVKQTLAQQLGLGDVIDIEIDISDLRQVIGSDAPDFMTLDGDPVADDLAQGLGILYADIANFQYPNPPSPGGMAP